MEKHEFTKDEVQEFHGFKESCSEGFKFKCINCGTIDTATIWLEHDNTCRGCGGSERDRICSRCDLPITLTEGSADHPCNSIKIYNESSRIIFYDEMMLEYAKLKKHKTTKESTVIEDTITEPEDVIIKPRVEPEKKIKPSEVVIPKIEEKETRIDSIKRKFLPKVDMKKLSELSEKIYHMGKIPRSIIKALRRFLEIVTFSKS